VYFIGLFVSRRITYRQAALLLHDNKTPGKAIGYT
jgi:hypothetical protein